MSQKAWVIVPGVALLCVLAMFAGSRLPGNPADPQLFFPKTIDSAVKFRTAQEAVSALMPKNDERTIPLSLFKGVKGLQVGVRISADTALGKKFVGTVTAIGADQITVRVEYLEDLDQFRK